jgi:hypothetical protein
MLDQRAALAFSCALAAWGCGDDSGSGGAGSGSTTVVSTGTVSYPACPGDPAPGLMCNAPAPCKEPVDLTRIASDRPAPAGGTVVDGVYLLTEYNKYTGPGGEDGTMILGLEQVIVFVAGEMRITRGSAGAEMVSGGTYATAGSNLTFQGTCPNTGDVTYAYTATPTGLRLHYQVDEELVFVRVSPAGGG